MSTTTMWQSCLEHPGRPCCVHEGRTSLVDPEVTGRTFGCCWCNQSMPEEVGVAVPQIPEPVAIVGPPPHHGPLFRRWPPARRR